MRRTLWVKKGGDPALPFDMFNWQEPDGGQLAREAMLPMLGLATLSYYDPGIARYKIMGFDPVTHYSRQRFLENTEDTPLVVKEAVLPPPNPLPPGSPRVPEGMETSTTIMNQWESKVRIVQSLLSVPCLEPSSQEFLKWWDMNSDSMASLLLYLRRIENETSQGLKCYRDITRCMGKIARPMMLPSFRLTFFNNKAAICGQRPDVIGVVHAKDVAPSSRQMMKDGSIVIADISDNENAKSGFCQLIQRCRDMRQAKQLSVYGLAGGLTDNHLFWPAVVYTGSRQRLYRTESPLLLVKEQQEQDQQQLQEQDQQQLQQQVQQQAAEDEADEMEFDEDEFEEDDPDDPDYEPDEGEDEEVGSQADEEESDASAEQQHWQIVDTTTPTFKELAFIMWLAVKDFLVRATAEPRVACLQQGQHITVRSTTGMALQLVVDSMLSKPGSSGCVYAAVPAGAVNSAVSSSSRLVLKVGPPSLLARQAIKLGLPRMAWTQVERERHVRQMLGDVACPGLSHTICLGHLDLERPGQQHALQGAPVVVTDLCGQPLLTHGLKVHPMLAPAQADVLVRQLAVPLLLLQCRGFFHLDVHVRNMAVYVLDGRLPPDSFYLYDLGFASTPDDWQKADWQFPMSFLFSCQELLIGELPGPLADLQSLVFVALSLAGIQLPWAEAAEEHDALVAHADRCVFMGSPSRLQGWTDVFSPDLRHVLEQVLATALEGRSEQQKLVEWLAGQWLPPAVSKHLGHRDILVARDQHPAPTAP